MTGISFIIIKYKGDFYENLVRNIGQSCDCPHEIVEIDNTKGVYSSIAVAYNSNVARAKFELICFLHEDVLFKHSCGWNVLKLMSDHPDIGLLGLVGAKFKSLQVTSYTNKIENRRYIRGRLANYQTIDNKPFEEVVCVDGVFLLTRKSLLSKIMFDERIITGFHGYDMDFSLQVFHAGYKVAITQGIDLIHFSTGKRDLVWLQTNQRISQKWRKLLPIASRDLKYGRAKCLMLEVKTFFWLNELSATKALLKFPVALIKWLLVKWR
jgi:GT2 family glycosyltransferase